mmetsp:Transcript_10718/g.15677  ORF Transcript_10718/g.15677 Transcript_10718/m.15677 type:complete len:202 (+) Transcript_10718:17-622(+)
MMKRVVSQSLIRPFLNQRACYSTLKVDPSYLDSLAIVPPNLVRVDPFDLLSNGQVVIQHFLEWGDMDAFQHVNNVSYYRFAESSRIAFFQLMGYQELMATRSDGPILASLSCKFLYPVTYPDTLYISTSLVDIPKIGDKKYAIRHDIVSAQAKRVVATLEGVVVHYNYDTLKSEPLDAFYINRMASVFHQHHLKLIDQQPL